MTDIAENRAFETDQKVELWQGVHSMTVGGATRISNYGYCCFILPPRLRALWDGVLAGRTVGELIETLLAANFPDGGEEARAQATRETQELLLHLADRQVITVGRTLSIWASTEASEPAIEA